MERQYIAIDLKSFYASVECVERELDPLTARLVVADLSRTEKTICLAVSPALKAIGLGGRERLYKVIQVAKRAGVDFLVAPPRMQKYMEISRKIYAIYASFVAPEDIHVYSIDEVFIDATNYLKTYKMSAYELAMEMIQKVLKETGITATAGIGTNLYLAKVAMDIVAKHETADENGVRIASLDEKSYREKLWDHRPLTDFWRIGPGYARRLGTLGIKTMGELARYSLVGSEKLRKVFGVQAELLIDHAWGYEPVTMADVKKYQSENHSVSSGQVLHEPYDFDEARTVVWEMAEALAMDLFSAGLMTKQLVLFVGYDNDFTPQDGIEITTDFYGRKVPKPSRGTINLANYTFSAKTISEAVVNEFEKVCFKNLKVRRIMIAAERVLQRENAKNSPSMFYQADLFTDYEKKEADEAKEERLLKAELAIKKRYGKNSILKLKNYEKGATMRARNMQIGGHKA